jgi:hypothetical protein
MVLLCWLLYQCIPFVSHRNGKGIEAPIHWKNSNEHPTNLFFSSHIYQHTSVDLVSSAWPCDNGGDMASDDGVRLCYRTAKEVVDEWRWRSGASTTLGDECLEEVQYVHWCSPHHHIHFGTLNAILACSKPTCTQKRHLIN